ncbi:hypothetical protein SAMN05421846_10574 [Chryseobacterium taeanense]|uniref:Uncharacterized protein n=1 Tax=Chryseobacterium taeanense TaxID=311334 RepID=A0A1G8IRW8_9FLAO|nr:hypothetical protein [Chryseobacterium taeanense]SDI21748.1 hypothetical protein SAMN05421846_10574 [Chryseobacterium taeanense]
MSESIYTCHQKIIDEKFDFIDQWLPARYTDSVNIFLKKESKDANYIRQVRMRKINDEKVTDALYKVSLVNKLQVEIGT